MGRLAILLVEDHADSREALAELLVLYGHAVTSTDSVAAALAAFAGGRFDLVVSDIGLPDGSGLDLMRELRARHGEEVKGVCLSGFGMEEDMRQSAAAGFLAHLTKPVNLKDLEAVLATLTAEPALRPETSRP